MATIGDWFNTATDTIYIGVQVITWVAPVLAVIFAVKKKWIASGIFALIFFVALGFPTNKREQNSTGSSSIIPISST